MISTARAPQRTEADTSRVRALDGVRGIAALMVVVHHALQVDPTFARVQAEQSAAGESGVVWALTHTPLHILWAGEEAVLVFFVLSGFVLALPAMRGPIRWSAYYPRRLVRLYLPVWASLAAAVALKAALPVPGAGSGTSAWLAERAAAPLGEVWHDALLVDGAGLLNPPLWSLRWEVPFSLALPAYVLLLRRRRPALALLEVGALLTMIGVGTVTGSLALRYLPVFGLGVLLALHQDRFAGLGPWVDARRFPRLAWATAAVGVACLLTARWLVHGLPDAPRLAEAAASAATIAGAVGALLLALHWRALRAGLERPAAQWVGTRSFSLYLVHDLAIVALAVLAAGAWGPWPAATVGAVLALPVAAGFYHVVERPSIALSRSASRMVRRRQPA